MRVALCRFKAAALPLSFAQEQVARADAKVLRAVGSKEELVLDVHAAFVAGLKQVCVHAPRARSARGRASERAPPSPADGRDPHAFCFARPHRACVQVTTPLTKVVVLDRDASDAARDVARALRRGGLFSAYVLQVCVCRQRPGSQRYAAPSPCSLPQAERGFGRRTRPPSSTAPTHKPHAARATRRRLPLPAPHLCLAGRVQGVGGGRAARHHGARRRVRRLCRRPH